MPRTLPAALFASACFFVVSPGYAADLDGAYAPRPAHSHVRRVHVERDTIIQQRLVDVPVVRERVIEEEVVEARVVEERIVEAPTPVPVGGPYLVIPGLNGPYGPPIYPLLPFSFGYGY